jgi:hypothetical protein
MHSWQGGRETVIHRIASPATPLYLADRKGGGMFASLFFGLLKQYNYSQTRIWVGI